MVVLFNKEVRTMQIVTETGIIVSIETIIKPDGTIVIKIIRK
jgi:hypothetical protein